MSKKKPKRGLSRKGCLSCKKLKIKCDEAQPACEYCTHTNRRCVYPDAFQRFENGLVPEEVQELYSSPSASSSLQSSPFEDEVYSESRRLTFQILLGCTATQLQLLRFELRVLRFYTDVCLPHITFNVNKRHVYIWNEVIPQYFSICNLMRNAILATGCLSLMPVVGVQHVLEDSMDEKAVQKVLETTCGKFEVLRIFADGTMFEDEPRDINLFMKATEFVSESIRASNEALAKLQQPDLSREERLPLAVDAALSNGLLFGFLGLQPWGLVPLVHLPQTHEDNKTDLLHVAHGLRTIVLEHHDVLLSSDIRDLYYQDELNLAPKKRVKIVEDLNYQLNEYLQGTSFFDIDAETAKMINAFHHCLHTLERVCVLGMKFNYPVMLFRWLLFVSLEINAYVRAENPFALRLLYVYACLCVHYKFWLFEQHNLWRDFVRFYRKHYGPLCEFDERLYHYVISKKRFVQNDDYVSIKDFDVWSPAFDYK